MAEYQRAVSKKKGDLDQKNRTRQPESQTSIEKSYALDEGKLSLIETPFVPRMEEHAAIISRTASPEQNHQYVMNLQRAYGNQYVQRLLKSIKVQAKLTVSAPDDAYEQEADRVAEKVVRSVNRQVQRQAKEEEEEPLQGKPLINRQVEEGELQTQPDASQLPQISDNIESRIDSARGKGQPLTESILKPMDRAFGADFSGVRTHTDTESDILTQKLQAKAFTTGPDIFFKRGYFNSASSSGLKLIAHELTHVVQQNAGLTKVDSEIQRMWECGVCHSIVSDTEKECPECHVGFKGHDPLGSIPGMNVAADSEELCKEAGGKLGEAIGMLDSGQVGQAGPDELSVRRHVATSAYLNRYADAIAKVVKMIKAQTNDLKKVSNLIGDLDEQNLQPRVQGKKVWHLTEEQEMIAAGTDVKEFLGRGRKQFIDAASEASDAKHLAYYLFDRANNMEAKGYGRWVLSAGENPYNKTAVDAKIAEYSKEHKQEMAEIAAERAKPMGENIELIMVELDRYFNINQGDKRKMVRGDGIGLILNAISGQSYKITSGTYLGPFKLTLVK